MGFIQNMSAEFFLLEKRNAFFLLTMSESLEIADPNCTI